jgi:hypothetical protein
LCGENQYDTEQRNRFCTASNQRPYPWSIGNHRSISALVQYHQSGAKAYPLIEGESTPDVRLSQRRPK